MTENDVQNENVSAHPVRDQLAKLLLATAAGFVASRLAETAYDKLIERGRKPAEVQE